MTTGALLDTLCSPEAPVTFLLLYDDFLFSASIAAACGRLWSLKYDRRHKPAAHIPAGCAHAAVTRDAGQVFYVRQQSQTEVISWNTLTGQCWTTALLGPSRGSESSSWVFLSQVLCRSAWRSLLRFVVWS